MKPLTIAPSLDQSEAPDTEALAIRAAGLAWAALRWAEQCGSRDRMPGEALDATLAALTETVDRLRIALTD